MRVYNSQSILSVVLAMTLLVGCSDSKFIADDSGVGQPDTGGVTDSGPLPDIDPNAIPGIPVVYAHSSDTLYQVDPNSFQVTKVADFSGASGITDIAIDSAGKMTGITLSNVYSIDPMTAACTQLSGLSRSFNGLSYVVRVGNDGAEFDVLVGTTLSGELFEIDPNTGQSTKIGDFGGDWQSSGDVVFVKGFGAVVTVKDAANPTASDWLARLDVDTGAITPIGQVGFSNVWGLGFWAGKVYGFTEAGAFILIDVATGLGAAQQVDSFAWWGAGVTTKAKVIE